MATKHIEEHKAVDHKRRIWQAMDSSTDYLEAITTSMTGGRTNCCLYEGDYVNRIGFGKSWLGEAETEGSLVEEHGQPPVDSLVKCSLSPQKLSSSQYVIFCPTWASHIWDAEVIVLV